MMCDIVIIASERAEDILYKLLLKKETGRNTRMQTEKYA